jgi:GT2 family glycosyltransferase
LIDTLPGNFRGEIIVVDDASTDETLTALKRWTQADQRIRVVRNEQNKGFIGSCNAGAGAAHGEMLVFLNNDTLPQPGWLPPLLRILRERPDAGAVGGKLIYPDGTLQEAGGIVFADGSGCNFGRNDKSSNAPLYNFLREVDYCSGALLATPRALFHSLGGFDTRFAPAYYEDTDYCFSLREAGHKVYYQPESVIIHFEGVSSGTDVKSGVKSFQAVNRVKFVEKWQHVLKRQPAAPRRYDFNTLHALSVREDK